MNRLALFVIRVATPSPDREWVLGDTVEEFDRIERAEGRGAAQRWLRREAWRVLAWAPRHRMTLRRSPPRAAGRPEGDGTMSAGWQDLRYALRLLGRAPGFTTIAVLTLGLGIGANAAMFAVVNAVLLKPLPFKDADRLMLVHMMVPDREQPGVFREQVWSYPKYRTFAELQQVFDETAFFSGRDFDLSGDGAPERVRGEVISDRYPAVLGVNPIIGRAFVHDEVHKAGTTPVAIIGYGLWTRRFGSDPGIAGRTIQINGAPYSIVGVLPRNVRGLSGDAEVWVPLAALEPYQLDQAQSHSYYMVARRKPDVSEQAALAAVRVLGAQVDAAHRRDGSAGTPWGAAAASLYASRADVDVRRASYVLLGAVGFVLLIACVNLTNLLAARALARRREVAVRVAIGASRGRIVRQFFAEGLLLSVFGAATGLIVASGMLTLAGMLLPDSDVFFRTAVAPGTPRTAGAAGLTRIGAAMIGLDWATLLFTCGAAIATAMFVSLLPAAQASALSPVEALKAGRAAHSRGLRWLDTRAALAAAQIALALILLTGAGLMIRSAEQLRRTDLGVTHENVLTVRVDLPRATYPPEKGGALFSQLVERLRAIPGIESVALGSCPPVSGGCSTTIMWFPPGGPLGRGRDPLVGIHWVTPDYFSTLGIRLLRGRSFSDRDRAGQPHVLLVNEAAARAIWQNADPIGKTVAVGMGSFGDKGGIVIGVVSDVRYRTIETAPRPEVYLPLAQSFEPRMRLFVRSDLDTKTLIGAVAGAVRTLDPTLPLSEIKTMKTRLGDAMWRTRVSVWLLSTFSGLALLLTAIGIFGVMAQTVAQRTSEIGIRMALGAQSRDVLALVLRRVAVVTGAGIIVGLAGALTLTRVISALLYGVRSNDPATLMVVASLLGVIALAAGYLPARRAARVDPIAALKAE